MDGNPATDCNAPMGGRATKVLARRLRALRPMRGWTQEDLAEACRLHRTYISMVERGQCNIGLDNLEKLADAFGLSLPEFLACSTRKASGNACWSCWTKHSNARNCNHADADASFRTVDSSRADPALDPATPVGEFFRRRSDPGARATWRATRVRTSALRPTPVSSSCGTNYPRKRFRTNFSIEQWQFTGNAVTHG